MPESAFIALVHNGALLLALAFVYDLTISRYPLGQNPRRQLLFGLVLGAMGIGIMLAPFELAPGIRLNAGSVLLAVSGLFFGFIPTLVAMLLTAAYRLSQGGAAAWTGAGLILAAGGLGLAWRRFRGQALAELTWRELYGLGLIVHVVMLALLLTLGWQAGLDTIAAVGLPVLLVLPLVTATLGTLLAQRLRHERTAANRWAVVESSPHPVYSVDARYCYTSFNQAHAAVMKSIYGVEIALGNSLLECHPVEADRQKKRLVLDRTLRGESVVEEGFSGNGENRRFFEVTHRPIRETSGAVVGVAVIARDQSVRRQAEVDLAAALRQAGRFSHAMDHIPAYIYLKDRAGRYIYANRPALELFKCSAEELPGRDDTQFFLPDTAARLAAIDAKVLGHGEDTAEEIVIQSADGSRRVYWEIKTPIQEGGEICGLCGISTDITAQKQTEASLRASEHRYRNLFENRHTVMLLIDQTDGTIVDANPAAASFYGWTRAELRKKKITEINQLSAADVRKEMKRAAREKQGHFEFRHARADGSARAVDVFSSPVELEGRQLLHSIVIDVTERRQTEEKVAVAQQETVRLLAEAERSRRALLSVVEDLRRAEERLHAEQELAQSTLDSLEEHICVLDAIGTIIAVNRAWRDFGAANGAGVNRTWLGSNYLAVCRQAVGAAMPQAAAFADQLEAVIAGQLSELELEYPCHTPGEQSWFVARVRRFSGEGAVRVVIAHENITVRKVAEEEIRASETRYREIFEGSPIGIWEEDFSALKQRFAELRAAGVTDFRHHFEIHPEEVGQLASLVRIVSINDTAWKMLGCKNQAEFVSNLTAYFTEESLPVFKEEVIALAGGALRFDAEMPVVDRQGNHRTFDLSLVVSQGHEHTLSRVLVTSLDITERKVADRALRDSLREKEALLKEVHHRVKNNLQVITSLLRLEAGRNLDYAARGVLKEMQGRIRSMALLHETLYRSSNLAQVDLGVYLERVAGQTFRSLNELTGRLRLRLELPSCTVSIDQAIPCGLIINEMVSNSLKHAFPDGRTGQVDIFLQHPADGGQVRLRVTDNGVGLPADFIERRERSLGIQLVADLVRQLQGTLETGPGPGAEFVVVFPLAPNASASPFPN